MASSRFILGVLLSGGFHVLAYVQMSHAKASAKAAPPPIVIEVDTSVAPPPPPPPEATSPSPEPSPAKAAPTTPKTTAPPRSAEPAQAAKTLTAPDDAPAAMADFTMVQGGGATFAGGVTTSAGTSRSASEGVARKAGPAAFVGGGNGGDGNGAGPDRSRPARPMGSDWDCKALFPASANVDTATVVIVARVRTDGTPESVNVVTDPGQGFGAAARACAMRQRYSAAEDREGRAIAASTAPFRVRFTR